MNTRQRNGRRAISILGLVALLVTTLQLVATPSAIAAPIFADDFDSANLSNWTQVTRITIDGADGSPAAPSASGQVTSQSAFAYRNLDTTASQFCMSLNVNQSAGGAFDLFRLRTATGGPIVKVFRAGNGTLRIRSDFGSTVTNSGVTLGAGWHNVELCGTVGTTSTWDLYLDGVLIVDDWTANTGTNPVGRVQIGDTASKTWTANFDHVVLDQVVGDEGGGEPDTTPPTTPGQPAGSSPSTGSIQISWSASSDASPPITYRIYRDGGATPIGSTTNTTYTDTGLTSGATHAYTVDAIDAANNESAMSPASAPITVSSDPDPDPGGSAIFADDFDSGDLSNWTQVTRINADGADGSPAAPSARGQVTSQSAFAYRNLDSTASQVCMSLNVNLSSGTALDLFRLRSSTGGPIVKVFVSGGTLRIRSDFGSTVTNSGVALGSGWHNVELCGTVGTSSAWDLYRDGVLIVDDWAANTGTNPVGRVQIGDTASKTWTANFDHVVLDQAVGDGGGGGDPGDTTPPTTPGQPTGSSPTTSSIQISWAASTDASPPITYRIYRDGGSAPIGETTNTTYTDTGLASGTTHTYRVDAVDAADNESAMSPASAPITVMSNPGGGQPVPGHTQLPPDTPRTNTPYIGAGDILDLEVIGDRIFIAGTFTSIRNNAGNNTTSYNQRWLAAFDIDTGLVDPNFRPTFDRSITEIEATPDGTKLFVAGRFNAVNGISRRKIVALNPTTGAVITSFTANANSIVESVEATNSTVYIGGDFWTVNGVPRVSLAAVNATTGQVVSSFVNDLSGGIGVDGRLTVQALALTHDETKLIVVHTGRQINGQDRYGVGMIDLTTNQLMSWRSQLWDSNLQFVGGIQRIFAGAVSPDDSYFVVTSGAGGDRPPISDTAIAFPVDAEGPDVQPLWISRAYDSIYSVSISEVGVFLGGHLNWLESPTAPDPWPGLDNIGYGWGQGLSGYALGDDVVRREHIGAVDAVYGKALEWDPGSTSYEGNQAMLAFSRGVVTGGDGNTQGGLNTGRVAFYDFNSVPSPGANETTIVNPIAGRIEEADVEFLVEGTATAASGVERVQLEVRDRDSRQYLQDDLTTWGGSNTINVNLDSPGATSTGWSMPLTISGNRRLQIWARTFANNGSNDPTKASKKFETFGFADQTPTTSINGPSSPIPTLTFTVTGTAQDDVGVNSITLTMRDASNNWYLQDDGTVEASYNTFRAVPDVVGATSATWSYEITVPYEGQWEMQAIAVDTAGQSDLRSANRTWFVAANAIEPTVSISAPAAMVPPTDVPPITMAPGSPLTFSGSATDDQGLNFVEIILRNTVTRENLTAGCDWGTDLVLGWCRISGNQNLPGTSYNWSYTTPFNLRPGTYQFLVRAQDDQGLVTSSTYRGELVVNVQVPGDAPPNTTISPTGTQPNLQVLHLDLAGTATDDFGVAGVGVVIEDVDTNRYIQQNGTLAAPYVLLPATVANPGATSTTWTLSVDLPSQGDYAVTAIAFDTSDQQDLSTSGATARYPAYPGDMPPTFVEALFNPVEGQVFTEARIVASGRAEDDQAITQVQIAIRNSQGLFMNSSGAFTSTNINWRTAFLNSPGSPGSNYAYTSPPIPSDTYTVFARAIDQHGFTTDPPWQRNNITVTAPAGNQPPVANFTYSCTENVCSFDGRSSTDENQPTLLYSWNFGNGSGSGPVPTRTYTSANTYTVTLTVTDEYGLTGTTSQIVTIVEPSNNVAPTPVINPPSCSAMVCNFSSVGSADPNTGDTFTRLWDWGDGTPTSTSTAPSHTFPAPGVYTVTLTVTDGWGKSASTSIVVDRTEPPDNQPPTAAISTPSCIGITCAFSGLGSSDPEGTPISYLWDWGDGTPTSTSAAPSHTFPAPGVYTVTLTVADGWGDTATTSLVVDRTEPASNQPPTAVIAPPNCTGLVCSFSGTGSSDPNGDSITYLWDWGDATATSTSSAPTHTFATGGTYTVTLTVRDVWGRTGTTTTNVTVP